MTTTEEKMLSILGEDLIREVNRHPKFYVQSKLDSAIMSFGMETLYYVSQLEATMNKKASNNPKGLLRTLDLLDSIYGLEVIHWKSILQLRAKLFGKKYVRKCCNYAIFRGYANDLDIVKTLRDMHVDQKKLSNKKRKVKALK